MLIFNKLKKGCGSYDIINKYTILPPYIGKKRKI